MLPERGKLLRIFIGESDRHDGLPLYEWIVRKAREIKMAGATVFRGIEGFGAKSHLHTAKILRLSQDLPILIEIIDVEEKIDNFVKIIDPVIKEGIVTSENIEVKFSRSGRADV
jgi:PII-like signaling protein